MPLFPGFQPINPFVVSGSLEDRPSGITVTVTNVDTTDFETVDSNSNGQFLIDVANFPNGLTSGNTIRISAAPMFQQEDVTYSTSTFGEDVTLNRFRYFVDQILGSDSNTGVTWGATGAWATIDKAATTAIDGTDVHIADGTYSSEPSSNDIAPVNSGAYAIKYYIWGTAGTTGTIENGSGDAYLSVEKNS